MLEFILGLAAWSSVRTAGARRVETGPVLRHLVPGGGLTVVAFGTSAPEMAVSVQSAWSGRWTSPWATWWAATSSTSCHLDCPHW